MQEKIATKLQKSHMQYVLLSYFPFLGHNLCKPPIVLAKSAKKLTSFIKWNDGIESGRTAASKTHYKRNIKIC